MKDALETFKDFDTGGLTPAKITFTPTDHRPFMSVNIMEMQKGKLVIKKTDDPSAQGGVARDCKRVARSRTGGVRPPSGFFQSKAGGNRCSR